MQTWQFTNPPIILASSAVGGPMEEKGPLGKDFDILHQDLWMEQDSYEKAQTKMLEEAFSLAIQKAGLKNGDIQFLLSGDLLNQITSSSFSARNLGVPFLGLYGACSTFAEGLSLASLIIDSGKVEKVLCGTVSHNAAVEKQFRYPTEYGSQKPPTSQWTATAAGAIVLSSSGQGIKVTSATIGKVIDLGISDPFNMGAVMAPAAVDTIVAHLQDTQREPKDYDLILTGDLGKVGQAISLDLLVKQKIEMPLEIYQDCGLMIYDKNQPVLSGGSGCGCSASVVCGHILKQMPKKSWKRILVVSTGALLSPLSYQQKETIPGIAHAVCLEA